MPPPTLPNLNLTSNTLFDALILGSGPAGLSAALALSRQGRPAAVFSAPNFRNDAAQHMHTVLGWDHTKPADFRGSGRGQIEAYGSTRFVERRITSGRKVDADGGKKDGKGSVGFGVTDETGEVWKGRTVVLAMGVKDLVNDEETGIQGYVSCWGKHIWQCLFCDGIERQDRSAGVLVGYGNLGLHYVGMVLGLGVKPRDVTVFVKPGMDVEDEEVKQALKLARFRGCKVEMRRVKGVKDAGIMEVEVVLEDGETMRLGFLTHAPKTAFNGRELYEQLGVEIVPDGFGGEVAKSTKPFRETNIKRVFVAGDAGTPMKQVTAAMYHGVSAGAGVHIKLLTEEEAEIAKRCEEADEKEAKEGIEAGGMQTYSGH